MTEQKRPILIELSEYDARYLLRALDRVPPGWRDADNTRVHRKVYNALNGLGQANWVRRPAP